MIFALLAVPTLFITGAGIDYTTAAYREDELNGIADAAALAGVTPTMMTESDASSIAAATSTFNAEVGSVSGVAYNPANLSVATSDNGGTRNVTVSYTAASQTMFAKLLGVSTIGLSGSSTATSTSSPNINFYLLLDDSPSMAIAATQTDITTMVNNTPSQGGCAFGCHESDPAKDSLGNPHGEDNYALARALGVTLRIDLLSEASQNLMTTAQSTAATNEAAYQMAIYTFDVGFNTIQKLTSNLSTAQTAASKISVLEVYANNWLTSTNNNNDVDTNYDNAMSSINTIMPNPGDGTKTVGDTPQEVLFFVTDGVEDECMTPTLNAYTGGGCRQQYLMNSNTDWCTTIKSRGIRIAVLYTEYLPLPTNGWYVNFDGAGAGISSFQPEIASQLQTCASPGLFFEVDVGQDISAAMAALFQSAVETARLSK